MLMPGVCPQEGTLPDGGIGFLSRRVDILRQEETGKVRSGRWLKLAGLDPMFHISLYGAPPVMDTEQFSEIAGTEWNQYGIHCGP